RVTTNIYTLSLHDALPILESDRIKLYSLVGMTGKPNLKRGEPMNTATTEPKSVKLKVAFATQPEFFCKPAEHRDSFVLVSELDRSEEHTSELQSRENLVCR